MFNADIASVEDAVKRLQQLHARGPTTVVISSLNANIVPDGQMVVLGSTRQNSVGRCSEGVTCMYRWQPLLQQAYQRSSMRVCHYCTEKSADVVNVTQLRNICS